MLAQSKLLHFTLVVEINGAQKGFGKEFQKCIRIMHTFILIYTLHMKELFLKKGIMLLKQTGLTITLSGLMYTKTEGFSISQKGIIIF